MIHTHRWDPPQGVEIKPQGVYLLHGTGEHAARYERLALLLASQGFRVAAHDHPGHGRSEGQRGVVSPKGQLVSAAAAEVARFARETGAAPFLFGHSLGGVVATELLLTNPVEIAGLVLSAPAIVPRLRWRDRVKLQLLTWLAPKRVLEFPYDASGLTHDLQEREKAHADPLIHGFKSASLVQWLIAGGYRAIEGASELRMPLLLLIAGSDRIIDTEQTRIFASRLPQSQLTLKVYENSHHELLNELPAVRDAVAADIVEWLLARALPKSESA